ncbi:hypothetical protein SARC_17831, partial [Sphaeroforma arctica JP610]
YRLVGTGFDVQLWQPDDRSAATANYPRPYPGALGREEGWIRAILDPAMRAHGILQSGSITLPDAYYSPDANHCSLICVQLGVGHKDGKKQ